MKRRAFFVSLGACAFCALPAIAAASQPQPGNHGRGFGLLLVGPASVVLASAILAVIAIGAAGFHRAASLWDLLQRASERSGRSAALPFAWGAAIVVASTLLTFVLFSMRMPILGLVALVAGAAALALGLAAASLTVGRAVDSLSPTIDIPDSSVLARGWLVLLLASVIPGAGWAAAIWAVCAGIGAVAESLVSRPDTP